MNKLNPVDCLTVFLYKNPKNYSTAFFTDCKNLANDLVENGYTRQEWISVNDSLPPEEGRYWVHLADGRTVVNHFVDYYGDGKGCFDNYNVTHWMYLPKNPKKKGE
jgi:hypothetical protein